MSSVEVSQYKSNAEHHNNHEIALIIKKKSQIHKSINVYLN